MTEPASPRDVAAQTETTPPDQMHTDLSGMTTHRNQQPTTGVED